MSEDILRKLALQVRNWGTWGWDDEIGTPNYITPDAIAHACRLATAGKVFEGPPSGTRQRFNPIHTMFRDGGDQPKSPAGAAKDSSDKTKSKIVGRGLLLDVARHKGVPALAPDYAITAADLEATAAAEHVEVQRGDLLLIRTGHMSRYLASGDWRHFDHDDSPGVSVHAAPWMHGRLGEIFFLEEPAADCAADGRYAFLLVAPPLPVTHDVGTPINAYAIK